MTKRPERRLSREMDFVQAKAKVVSDSTGATEQVPVVLTASGVLEPLVDFVLSHSHDRSTTWMNNTGRAARLFLQFADAQSLRGLSSRAEDLFRQFVLRLSTGTVGKDGLDPSGLYWFPLSPQICRTLVTCLTEFSSWLSDNRHAVNMNPLRPSSSHEQALDSLAAEYRRNKSFLSHVLKEASTSTTVSMRPLRPPKVDEEHAVAFPEEHFTTLIQRGFACAGVLNLRDILIALLMHGAGFRVSECFHLWVHDVVEDPVDPSVALVRIHHPQYGAAPKDWLGESGLPVTCNREAYLKGRYGLTPRNKVLGTMAAGWKNPMLDGKFFMKAHWFPQAYGRLFLQLWRLYLRQLTDVQRNHPFAFISFQGPTAGGMYSIDAFEKAHSRAVKRCGLRSAKDNGTSPHGHRHAFGQALRRAAVPPRLIQKAMHHKSLASQAVYTVPTVAETDAELNRAYEKLAAGVTDSRAESTLADLVKYGFGDVDPEGLLSGISPRLMRGARS